MNERKLLIIYASMHGQAELVARTIAGVAREGGVGASVGDVRKIKAADLEAFGAVIIVASIHFGRHSRAVTRFVKANRHRLHGLRTAFVSVSGAAAEAELRPEAEKYVAEFQRVTGWKPGQYELVGGAVKFSKYNFFIRWVTKRAIAAKGKAVDTTRDYDYTDWDAVRRFAKAFIEREIAKVA